jgi:hypothetical protein
MKNSGIAARPQNKPLKLMKITHSGKLESGKIGWALLWLIGIPIPVLLIFFMLRGCT